MAPLPDFGTEPRFSPSLIEVLGALNVYFDVLTTLAAWLLGLFLYPLWQLDRIPHTMSSP
ncbi:hypothetical protein EJ06DRAFT_534343 [Trichodelitschia bisporula]|uniref:Uncharacterized protein n=1 Tax=Trichodelitschia bisporula TaxID=703511 RepID=A0A6G1HJX3_9PEZI|nr:hypothetical protein EJ06DRAFT_534343 [Trichodelitschia bisporula]